MQAGIALHTPVACRIRIACGHTVYLLLLASVLGGATNNGTLGAAGPEVGLVPCSNADISNCMFGDDWIGTSGSNTSVVTSWDSLSVCGRGQKSSRWDLRWSSAVKTVLPGATVRLTCLTLVNALVALTPVGVPTLPLFVLSEDGARLELTNVDIITDCSTVYSYQEVLCSTWTGARVQVGPSWVTVWWLDTPTIEMHGVNITCNASAGSNSSLDVPDQRRIQPPCSIVGVDTEQQLLRAVANEQDVSQPLVVLIYSSLSFASNSTCPPQPLTIYSTVSLFGAADTNSPVIQPPLIDFDVGLCLSLFDVLAGNSNSSSVDALVPSLSLHGLFIQNVPPMYLPLDHPRRHLGILSAGFWPFNKHGLLELHNVTLELAEPEYSFWSYWFTQLLSPFQAVRRQADWMLTTNNITLEQSFFDHIDITRLSGLNANFNGVRLQASNSTLSNRTIVHVTAHNFVPPTLVYQARSWAELGEALAELKAPGLPTAAYGQHVLLVGSIGVRQLAPPAPFPLPAPPSVPRNPSLPRLPPQPPPLPPPSSSSNSSSRTLLMSSRSLISSRSPPNAQSQVSATGGEGRTISLSVPSPPARPSDISSTLPTLTVPTTFASWPDMYAALDCKGVSSAVTAQDTVTLRNVMLTGCPAVPPAANDNEKHGLLESGAWLFNLSADKLRPGQQLTLDHVALVVPQQEVLYHKQVSVDRQDSNLVMPVRNWITSYQVHSYNESWVYFSHLTTARFTGANVNITSVPPAGPCMDCIDRGETVNLSVERLSSHSSGLSSSTILAVALPCSLGAALVTFLWLRKRHMRRMCMAGKAAEDDEELGGKKEHKRQADPLGSTLGGSSLGVVSLEGLAQQGGGGLGSTARSAPGGMPQLPYGMAYSPLPGGVRGPLGSYEPSPAGSADVALRWEASGPPTVILRSMPAVGRLSHTGSTTASGTVSHTGSANSSLNYAGAAGLQGQSGTYVSGGGGFSSLPTAGSGFTGGLHGVQSLVPGEPRGRLIRPRSSYLTPAGAAAGGSAGGHAGLDSTSGVGESSGVSSASSSQLPPHTAAPTPHSATHRSRSLLARMAAGVGGSGFGLGLGGNSMNGTGGSASRARRQRLLGSGGLGSGSGGGPGSSNPCSSSSGSRNGPPSHSTEGGSTAAAAVAAGAAGAMLPIGAPPSGMNLDVELEKLMALNSEIKDRHLEVQHSLGWGAHGVVYKGLWKGLPVAVKIVLLQGNEQASSRHLLEAAISASLVHPNIVTTYLYDLAPLDDAAGSSGPDQRGLLLDTRETGPHCWKLCIVQEYCDQGTLKTAVDQGWLLHPEDNTPDMVAVLQIALDVVAGLVHIHSKNIIHGDLSPSNVLLQSQATRRSGYIAKVADFGLSLKMEDGQSHRSRVFQGTPHYIAPEVHGRGILSKAADVFALGVVLWELYMGTPSWRRQHHSPLDAGPSNPHRASSSAWLRAEPPDFPDGCHAGYASLVSDCCSQDPTKRPTTAALHESLSVLFEEVEGAREAAERAREAAEDGGDLVYDHL